MPNNSSEFNEASFREAYAQYLDECRRNEEARAMQRAREIERERMYAMPVEEATPIRFTFRAGANQATQGTPACPPPTGSGISSSSVVEEMYIPRHFNLSLLSEYEECTVSAPPPPTNRGYGIPAPGRVQPSENMRWRLYPDEPIKRVTALGNEF